MRDAALEHLRALVGRGISVAELRRAVDHLEWEQGADEDIAAAHEAADQLNEDTPWPQLRDCAPVSPTVEDMRRVRE